MFSELQAKKENLFTNSEHFLLFFRINTQIHINYTMLSYVLCTVAVFLLYILKKMDSIYINKKYKVFRLGK